jgi:DNA polymerase-3 subunit beta
MKVVVLKEELLSSLGLVERGSGGSAHLPILKNVLIEAKEKHIRLAATNLEIAVEARFSGKVTEAGSVTVPLGVFVSLVQALSDDRVTLEATDTTLHITTDQYEGHLSGSSVEEFPIIPQRAADAMGTAFPGDILRETLAQVSFAAQASDISPELSTVFVDFSIEAMRFVATDSFRLAERTLDANRFETAVKKPFFILLPLRTASEIVRITRDGETVTMYVEEHQVSFETDRWTCVSRLVDATFPDYQQIIPQNFVAELTLDRQELLGAVKISSVMSNKNNEVAFSLSPDHKQLLITSTSETLGTNTARLPIEIKGSFERAVFNWRQLSEGLKAIKTSSVFFGINEEKPALLRGVNDTTYRYLIAPLLAA